MRSQTHLLLGWFDGQHNILNEFEKFCDALAKEHHRASREPMTWKVLHHGRGPGGHSRRGTVEVGDYGYRSRLMDLDSGENRFTRHPTHAELIPMLFLLDAPPSLRLTEPTVKSPANDPGP